MNPREYELQDSGERQTFDTGAQRDSETGKGRFDLLSPFVTERDAILKEKGALKYAPRNWEKGMPFSRCLDSALRHINKYQRGFNDEDHLAAARWNLAAIMHFEEMIRRGLLPESLNDVPVYSWTFDAMMRDIEAGLQSPVEDKSQLTFDFMVDVNSEAPPSNESFGGTGKLSDFTPPVDPAELWDQGWVDKQRFYVAGPFSGKDRAEELRNIEAAEAIGRQLAAHGHLVHVPHAATDFLHAEMDYEYFMKLDFSIIESWATALFIVDASPGTSREIAFAAKLGLPVYWDLADVPSLRALNASVDLHNQKEVEA